MSSPGKKAAQSADEWLLNGSEQSESTDPKANGVGIGTETAQWVIDPARDLGAAKETAAPSVDRPDQEVKRPDRAKVERADDALEEQRRENRELATRIREMQAELRAQEKEAQTELAKTLAECDAELKRQLRAAQDDANERLEQATTALVKKHDSRELRLTKTFEKQREELIKAFEKQGDELKKDSEKDSEQSETELRARIDELSSELARAQKAEDAGKKASSKRRGTAAKRETGDRKAREAGGKDGEVDLNQATFEELRSLGLSVTQSARVVAYRDVRDGFESLDELDDIPGLSKEMRSDLRRRLTPPG